MARAGLVSAYSGGAAPASHRLPVTRTGNVLPKEHERIESLLVSAVNLFTYRLPWRGNRLLVSCRPPGARWEPARTGRVQDPKRTELENGRSFELRRRFLIAGCLVALAAVALAQDQELSLEEQLAALSAELEAEQYTDDPFAEGRVPDLVVVSTSDVRGEVRPCG